jgi:ABC-type transporter Mla subunit MlaD
MTHKETIMETEAAIAALLDELEKLKSATEQLDDASVVAQEVSENSIKITNMAKEIMDNSGRQIVTTERLSNQVHESLNHFNHGISNLTDAVKEITSKQDDQTSRVTRISHELKSLQNNSSKLGDVIVDNHNELRQQHSKVFQQVERIYVHNQSIENAIKIYQEEQESSFGELNELVNKYEQNTLENLSKVEERIIQNRKMRIGILAVSVLNAIFLIVLLVLAIVGG